MGLCSDVMALGVWHRDRRQIGDSDFHPALLPNLRKDPGPADASGRAGASTLYRGLE